MRLHLLEIMKKKKSSIIKKKKDPRIAVLTLDSMGDFYNQTLWIPDKNKEIKI